MRSGAEYDVLGLGVEFLGDRSDEVEIGRCAVEWIAAGLGKLAEDGVECDLSWPERILVAVDADFGDPGRHERA